MSTIIWLCFVSFLCFGAMSRGDESFGYDLVHKDRFANVERKLADLITSLSSKQNETNARINALTTKLEASNLKLIERLTKMEKIGDSIVSKQKSTEKWISNIAANISALDSQSKQILQNHFDLVIPSCSSAKVTGVYRLQDPNINVYCEATMHGGGWLVIQKRLNGELDFNRSWYSYRTGFGTVGPYDEFWLGLEPIHQITSNGEYELRIDVTNESKERKHARYSLFKVASESKGYRLTIGGYSGTGIDALESHNNTKFSTHDTDNDGNNSGNCAKDLKSGWWFTDCRYSNLNGPFKKDSNTGYGIEWGDWADAARYSRMMIRRK